MQASLKTIALGFFGAFLFHVAHEQLTPNTTIAQGTRSVLTATGLNIVDTQGRLRVQIATSKEGPPGIWLMDEKGVPRLNLGLYPEGSAYVGLQDKDGQMVQLLRSVGDQDYPLHIFKNRGSDRMILGLNAKDLSAFLMSYGKDGKAQQHVGTYAP